jgi:hypothetical protein
MFQSVGLTQGVGWSNTLPHYHAKVKFRTRPFALFTYALRSPAYLSIGAASPGATFAWELGAGAMRPFAHMELGAAPAR